MALGIAARAVGARDVTAVRLPSRHTEQVHLDDAAATAAAVGLPDDNLLTVSIEPILDGLAVGRPDAAGRTSGSGNASARSRMIVIYDLAQALHALVLGTENRTENLLGYFTRFGDAASDIEPITDLYKTEVRAAARVLGQPRGGARQAPDRGALGRADRRGRARLHLRATPTGALVAMFDLGMSPAAAARSGPASRAATW